MVGFRAALQSSLWSFDMSHFLHSCSGRDRKRGDRPRRSAARRCPRFVPRVTPLEDRTLPSTFTVLNLNDSGPGSLRDGLASGDDTIDFAPKLSGTITLTSGELLVNNSVTINGPGAGKLSISGNDASRVFDIAAGFDVTISSLTITHGFAPPSAFPLPGGT